MQSMARARSVRPAHTALAVALILPAALVLAADRPTAEEATRIPGIEVPLNYRPDKGGVRFDGSDLKTYVAKPVDKRDVKSRIGQVVDKKGTDPVYHAGEVTPMDFVTEAMRRELAGVGVNLVDDDRGAERTVSVDIHRFYVQEGNRFEGTVTLTVAVTDRDGKELFKSRATGEAATWGKSRNPDNYNKVFSNATKRAVQDVLRMPSFQRAMR